MVVVLAKSRQNAPGADARMARGGCFFSFPHCGLQEPAAPPAARRRRRRPEAVAVCRTKKGGGGRSMTR